MPTNIGPYLSAVDSTIIITNCTAYYYSLISTFNPTFFISQFATICSANSNSNFSTNIPSFHSTYCIANFPTNCISDNATFYPAIKYSYTTAIDPTQ